VINNLTFCMLKAVPAAYAVKSGSIAPSKAKGSAKSDPKAGDDAPSEIKKIQNVAKRLSPKLKQDQRCVQEDVHFLH
jgi:hypothetical protein